MKSVREFVLSKLQPSGVKGIYLNVKIVNDAAKSILQYVRKEEELKPEDLSKAFEKLNTN